MRDNDCVYEDELSSARYAELTGVSKQQYEDRLLRSVQGWLLPRGNVPRDSEVESVTLTGDGEDTKIVVMFRVADRGAGRLFGWRSAIWPASNPSDPEAGTPEDYASLFPVYLDEVINTIPFLTQMQQQDDQRIVWVEDW